MQALRPSEVPEYLQSSSFFLGLNASDDDEFSIPLNHMKVNTNVKTLADMIELLNTIRFWGADFIPRSMFDFAARREFSELKPVLEPYRGDLKFLTTVCSIVSNYKESNVRLEKAMKSRNIDVVRYFHKKGEKFSAHALRGAAGNGALDCLQYALTTAHPRDYCPQHEIFTEAVRNGHLKCIRYLRQKGFSFFHVIFSPHDDLARLAASSGQCKVLKYLHKHGYLIRGAAIAAVGAGHFDCLEYAVNNGAHLPGEQINVHHSGSLADRLVQANQLALFPLALLRGYTVKTGTAVHLAKMSQWASVQLCVQHDVPPCMRLIAIAAQRGHLPTLQFLHQACVSRAEANEKGLHWLTYAMNIRHTRLGAADVAQLVADAKQWECLRFLLEHGCAMNKPLSTSLVQAGQLELYRLATALGCKVSVQTACQFASDGNLDLLQHALEHGCGRSDVILQEAARHGQLQCLMYAHAQGCSWSSSVTLAAARGGHLECLQYLHEQGCPWDARVRSVRRKQSILDYADAHDCPS